VGGADADALIANLETVRSRIASACARRGCDPADVTLVGATKSVPPEAIAAASRAGVSDFGENYVQELRSKRAAAPDARWHFIGTLQASSAHHVAALADVVQTLAGGHAMDRLARRAMGAGRVLDAMIEVDFTGERAGADPDDVGSLADRVATIDGLRLIGLMTVPPIGADAEAARPTFVRLRALRDRLRDRHPQVVELSMGMSLDYGVAVEEGATMVRVGTALFGPRTSVPGRR
jgi:pyridoxal phosphate enzyme (YggS family)